MGMRDALVGWVGDDYRGRLGGRTDFVWPVGKVPYGFFIHIEFSCLGCLLVGQGFRSGEVGV